MRAYLAGILIVALSFLGNANDGKAQQAPSKPPIAQSHKPTTDYRNDVQQGHPPQLIESPFEAEIVETLRAIVRQQQADRAEDEAKEARWWPPSPSWAIVYVTVAYVFVAIFQWSSIRRQANIAEKLPMIIEAPYVSIGMKPYVLQQGGIPNGNPWIEYWFKNNGRTQAQVIEYCVAFEICEIGEMPEKPHYESGNAVLVREHFIIPASAETAHARCSGDFDFAHEADFAPIRENRQMLFFYGYIRFCTVFKSQPPRIFGFDYFYDPGFNSLTPVGGTEYNYDREEKGE